MDKKYAKYRKEIEEYLKKNDPEIKQFFTYGSHLTDNSELVDAVIEACEAEGNKTLLVAPCGAGKTYSFCCEIAKREEGKRQVILLVPNRLQAEQNEQYGYKESDGANGHVISVTAGTDGTFQYDCKQAISAVYDSVHRMMNATTEELSRTVLVVDEAHQLVSARGYRNACIESIEGVINRVIECGGSVIFMTGTERKIRAMYYDRLIKCIPANEKVIGAGRVEISRNASHTINMKEHTFNYIVRQCERGYHPLVRINHKNYIEILATKLRAAGYSVLTLSSDDKGYYVDGSSCERFYDSEVYRCIMEESALPAADIYLTTSVLEVGTSIAGIKSEDGTVSQPSTMIPTFVCLKPDDFDVDDLIQFFSRLRFHYEKAAILVTDPKKKDAEWSSEPSHEKVLLRSYASAAERCEAFNSASAGRSEYIDMNGKTEKSGLIVGRNGRVQIDVQDVIGRSYGDYFRATYMQKETIVPLLRKELDVPVDEQEEASESVDSMRAEGKLVPADLQEELRSAIRHPYFRKALTKAKGIDGSNDEIKAIRKKHPDAINLMREIRNLLVSDAISSDGAVEIAIRQREEPGFKTEDARSGKVISFQEVARRGVFRRMEAWDATKILRIVNTWKCLHGENSEGYFTTSAYSNVLTEDKDLFAFNAVAETKKMEYLVTAFTWLPVVRKWQDLCRFFAEHDERECASYVRILQCIEMNKLYPGTKEYRKQVLPDKTVLGAEYNAFRCPERFFLKEKSNLADREEKNDFLFPDGIIGKTVTHKMMLSMSKQLNGIVRRQCRNARRDNVYTAVDIELMLKTVYRVRKVSSKNHDALVIIGLRKNASNVIPGEKPGRDEIVRFCDKAISGSRYLSKDERVRIFDHVMRWLEAEFGQDIINISKARIAGWIRCSQDTEEAGSVSYTEGELKNLLDELTLGRAG